MNGTTSRGSRQNAGAGRYLPGCIARQGTPLESRPATAENAEQEGWLPAGSADLATFAVALGLASGGFLSRSREAAAVCGEPRLGFWFTARELPWVI